MRSKSLIISGLTGSGLSETRTAFSNKAANSTSNDATLVDSGTRSTFGNNLRRFKRLNVEIRAFLHCYGRFQNVTIKDISRGGMMIDGAFGITPGCPITIELLSGRKIRAKAMWVISPRTGIMFDTTLAEDDKIVPLSSSGEN